MAAFHHISPIRARAAYCASDRNGDDSIRQLTEMSRGEVGAAGSRQAPSGFKPQPGRMRRRDLARSGRNAGKWDHGRSRLLPVTKRFTYDEVMSTRYTMLRDAVANLAAPAEAQVAYLDSIFSGLTGGKSAESYGNDELAMEFDDTFIAVNHMLEFGEISQSEIDVLRTVDDMLKQCIGSTHTDFWARKALFEDPRWEAIRLHAAEVLGHLPDEARESDWTRSLRSDGNGS